MNKIESIASRLYAVYCEKVGGVAFNGDKLPSWEEFSADPNKQKQADAWRAVALETAPESGVAKDIGQNIVVLDRGFVYVGNATIDGDLLTISNARCIRRWGTTKGLGQLATSGPTSSTVLDATGDVLVPLKAVIHFIKCVTNW